MKCYKCEAKSNIKINILNYCNNCFKSTFEKKVFRTINGINKKTRMCFILSESKLIYFLIAKYFENRPLCHVTIICDTVEEYQEDKRFHFKNRTQLDEMNYDMIVKGEPLEYIAIKLLEGVCNDSGKAQDGLEEDSYINLFKDIKLKEIQYYMYLNKIERVPPRIELNKTQEVLLDFLLEVDIKNNLAIYNVLNTFKKL